MLAICATGNASNQQKLLELLLQESKIICGILRAQGVGILNLPIVRGSNVYFYIEIYATQYM